MHNLSQFIVLAAHGGQGEPPLLDVDGTTFIQLGLFLIALALFNVLFFKPYLKLHEARKRGTTDSDEEAKNLSLQADQLLADYQAKFDQAYSAIEKERQSLFQETYTKLLEDFEQKKAALLSSYESDRSLVQKQAEEMKQNLSLEALELGKIIKDKLLNVRGA